MSIEILEPLNVVFVGYFTLLNGGYLVMCGYAVGALRRYGRRMRTFYTHDLLAFDRAPPITLIAPTYNEEAGCVESIRSLLTLNYPNYEVLVVNDGSTDGTLERLREAYDLEPAARYPAGDLETERVREVYRSESDPDLWVVDKENGGKADALNTGINFCQTPLFCAMDADTLIEREGQLRLARPFLEDDRTVAAGGIIRIVNGCTVKDGVVTDVRLPRQLLPALQVLEYLRAFLFGRIAWDALGATLIVSGAFGLFDRSVVAEAGGFATDTVGEDIELVVRLHRYCREQGRSYRIRFLPDPVAWTECPTSVSVLGRQRDRWQRGLTDTMVRHRTMLFDPSYGRVGTMAYPFFFFLETIGPAIEAIGYVLFAVSLALGAISWPVAGAFFLTAFIFGFVLSLIAILLEEFSFRRYRRFSDLARLIGLAVVDTFGYRQMNAYWRIKGLVSYLRGDEQWGAMERVGFQND